MRRRAEPQPSLTLERPGMAKSERDRFVSLRARDVNGNGTRTGDWSVVLVSADLAMQDTSGLAFEDAALGRQDPVFSMGIAIAGLMPERRSIVATVSYHNKPRPSIITRYRN